MNQNIPPPDYPVRAFPDIIQNAIWELQRIFQAPVPMIGSTLLAAMSVAAQSNVKVRLPISNRASPVTFFLLTIAESGERKSAIERAVFEPIYRLDAEREADHAKAMEDYRHSNLVWQQLHDRLVKQLANPSASGQSVADISDQLEAHRLKEPEAPRLRRLIRQDISERALLNALEGSGESVALLSDEAEILLRSPLFEKNGLMNKSWDGGTVVLDRANNVSFAARDMRMTISLMTQSAVIQDYVQKRGRLPRGSGFFARFLVSWPTSTQGQRFIGDPMPSSIHLEQFHGRIHEMLSTRSQGCAQLNRDDIEYELDRNAQDYFIDLFNQTEMALGPGGYLSDIQDFGSKSCEMAVRLAALFQHFSGQGTLISRDSIARASDLVLFHTHEFKRIFGTPPRVDPVERDAAALLQYLHNLCHSYNTTIFDQRTVQNTGPIQSRSRFLAAIKLLCQHRAIWLVRGKSRRNVIHVNLAMATAYLPR